MKKQNGVSLITLIVTIIVIIILASVAMASGVGSIEEANRTKIDMEIRGIKDAVSDRMIYYAQNSSNYPLVGKKVDDITIYLYCIDNITNEEISDFIENMSYENSDYYRVVDSIAAKSMGVESISEEHQYVVDYYTGKVFGPVNMKKLEAEIGGE